MARTLEELLDRLEHLIADVEAFDEGERATVFELLDGLDALHRLALRRLAAGLAHDDVARVRAREPVVRWLLDAYGAEIDDRAAAEAALEPVRPFVESHGGHIEVLDAQDGRVRVRLSGSCSGCSASSLTLTHGVEEALREGMPGFVALEAEEDPHAAPHAPPGKTLVELGRRSH